MKRILSVILALALLLSATAALAEGTIYGIYKAGDQTWFIDEGKAAEAAAKEAGYEVKVGKFPFTASGKAKAAGAPEGFVKVIYDAKYGEWLGAHMIGYNVTELIAEVVTARKLETTGYEIMKAVHPHPTMSEAVMEATAAAYGEVIHL